MINTKEKSRKKLSKQQKQINALGVVMLIYIVITLTIHFVVSAFTWLWFIFGFIAATVPCGMVVWYLIAKHRDNNTKFDWKFTISITAFAWSIDLLYMSIFNSWLICQFIFGGLAIVVTFYNLCVTFISNNEIAGGKWQLLLDFILGIGISIYLIYKIPNDTLQSIVTTIVAAVYGGLLTLVGVAWTIKKGDKDRKEDERKRENERKEEERKKYMPICNFTTKGTETDFRFNLVVNSFVENENIQVNRLKQGNDYYEIKQFKMYNSDYNGFFITGLLIQDIEWKLKHNRFIDKNSYFTIAISYFKMNGDAITDISILAEDILGNKYQIPLEIENELKYKILVRESKPAILIEDK